MSKRSIKKKEVGLEKKANKLLSVEKRELRGKPKGQGGRGRGSAGNWGRKMPVSVVHRDVTKKPIQRLGRNGATIIKHREFLSIIEGDVVSNPPTVKFYTWSINPGLTATFPWGNRIANNFTLYKPVSVTFHFVANVPTNTTGDIITCINTDPAAKAFTNISDMKQFVGSTLTSAFTSSHTRYNNKAGVLKKWFVRSDDDSPEIFEDLKFVDLGVFTIAILGVRDATGGQIADLGSLYVEYEFELSQVKEDIQGLFELYNFYAQSNTASMNNPFNDPILEYDASYTNVLYTNPSNTGYFQFTVQRSQAVMFTFVAIPPADTVIVAPSFAFNGVVLTLGTDYNMVFGSSQGIIAVGQVMLVEEDIMTVNSFQINVSGSAGIAFTRLSLTGFNYPFSPASLATPGLITTIPVPVLKKMKNKLKRYGWPIAAEVMPPMEMVQYQPPPEKPKLVNVPCGELHGLGPPRILKRADSLPFVGMLKKATVECQFPTDTGYCTESENPLLTIAELMLVEYLSTKCPFLKPVLNRFPDILDQRKFILFCHHLAPHEAQKVSEVLVGHEESNTFDGIMDSIGKAMDIGTKIFSMFG
jgi:hypothetical protein